MPSQWLILVTFISFVLVNLASSSKTQSIYNVIDTSSYYRVTNDYSGGELALDVDNDGRNYALKMAPIGDYSGQFWRFIPLGDNVYKLQTKFLKNAYSLDLFNDKNDRNDKMPHMGKTGRYTGQRWHLRALSDGSFRLFNDFTGNKLFLDVNGKSSRVLMNVDSDGEVDAGQHWTLTKLRRI